MGYIPKHLESDNLFKVLCKSAAVMLVNLEDGMSITDVYFKIGKEVAWTSIMWDVNRLENLGVVKTRKEGRKRTITFTEKGKKIKKLLCELKACADAPEEK
ncbi:MAG: hypothetical protein J7J91_06750 [Deltaproteobacteria bacterium]|nr:hypothetical protein [Deltaproteobacteria bacterium]